MNLQFTSEQHLGDGVLERGFAHNEIPGILWTPASAPAPLIPGGRRLETARVRHGLVHGLPAALALGLSGPRHTRGHPDRERPAAAQATRTAMPG